MPAILRYEVTLTYRVRVTTTAGPDEATRLAIRAVDEDGPVGGLVAENASAQKPRLDRVAVQRDG